MVKAHRPPPSSVRSETEPDQRSLPFEVRRSDPAPLALSDARFHHLLDQHFHRGTRPGGRPPTPTGRWTNAYLGKSIPAMEATVSGWRNGHTFPTLGNFHRILMLLFGKD